MDYNIKRSMILDAFKWHEKRKQNEFKKQLNDFYNFIILIILFYQIIFMYCSYYNINMNRPEKEIFKDIFFKNSNYIIPHDLD
jgi:hypothetical protein